jgi:hypothetical protein
MRKSITWLLGIGLLFSSLPLFSESNDAVEKTLQTTEQSLWQAWKDHNMKTFDSYLPENAINIVGGGMSSNKAEIMKELASPCEVNSFSLSNFKYMWLGKDAVLVIYDATQDATCGGKKIPDKVVASSLWQKKGGKWVSPFHQETTAGM